MTSAPTHPRSPDARRAGLVALDAVIAAGLAALVALGLLGAVRHMTLAAARIGETAEALAWAERTLVASPAIVEDGVSEGRSPDGRYSWTIRQASEPGTQPVHGRALYRIDVDVVSTSGKARIRLATRRWRRVAP